MALKKVKGNFERMFDKNLTDLVRGIRNNKDNEVPTVLADLSGDILVITSLYYIYCLFTSYFISRIYTKYAFLTTHISANQEVECLQK